MERIRELFKIAYGVGWLLIFLFFNWVVYGERVPYPLYSALVLTLCSLPPFWGNYVLLSRYFNRSRIGLYLLGASALLLLSPLPFLVLLDVDLGEGRFPVEYFPFLLLALLFLALGGIAKIAEKRLTDAFEREELEKQSMRSELAYLKAQINPHFLFNTLNNLHALAYKQSPDTPDAIMRLSAQMRYMIYESKAGAVALSREVEYLQDFISLQQLRYDASPIVDVEIRGDTDNCYVAPLLFIHLLENAYKHSPAHLEAGAIKMYLEVRENSIIFHVSNPVGKSPAAEPPEVMDTQGGFGLANVRKRLQLLYPQQHSFEIESSDTHFKVELKIDQLTSKEDEREADLLHRG
jgi:hypothetical protein